MIIHLGLIIYILDIDWKKINVLSSIVISTRYKIEKTSNALPKLILEFSGFDLDINV